MLLGGTSSTVAMFSVRFLAFAALIILVAGIPTANAQAHGLCGLALISSQEALELSREEQGGDAVLLFKT